MGETDMTLDKLPVGQTRRIAAVGGQGALRRRRNGSLLSALA